MSKAHSVVKSPHDAQEKCELSEARANSHRMGNQTLSTGSEIRLPVGRGISFGRLKQYNKMQGIAVPRGQILPSLGNADQLQMHPLVSSPNEVRGFVVSV